jgi:DnaJ-class molecular chaperone
VDVLSVIRRTCPTCEGSGTVYVPDDDNGVDPERCDTCAGDGEVVPASDLEGAVGQIGELQDALADALSGDSERIDRARDVLAIYEAAAALGGR